MSSKHTDSDGITTEIGLNRSIVYNKFRDRFEEYSSMGSLYYLKISCVDDSGVHKSINVSFNTFSDVLDNIEKNKSMMRNELHNVAD